MEKSTVNKQRKKWSDTFQAFGELSVICGV